MTLIFKNSKRTHLFEGQVLTIDCEVEGKPFYFFIYIPKDKAHFSDEEYFYGLISSLQSNKPIKKGLNHPFLNITPKQGCYTFVEGYQLNLPS